MLLIFENQFKGKNVVYVNKFNFMWVKKKKHNLSGLIDVILYQFSIL